MDTWSWQSEVWIGTIASINIIIVYSGLAPWAGPQNILWLVHYASCWCTWPRSSGSVWDGWKAQDSTAFNRSGIGHKARDLDSKLEAAPIWKAAVYCLAWRWPMSRLLMLTLPGTSIWAYRGMKCHTGLRKGLEWACRTAWPHDAALIVQLLPEYINEE